MNWGKVVFIFFALMSLTTTSGFLYYHSDIALFVAASVNVVSTILKIGVKNILSAELFATSLVADLHLIPAFIITQTSGNMNLVISMVIGAIIANTLSIAFVLLEAGKTREEF